jgi:hypothetical protein
MERNLPAATTTDAPEVDHPATGPLPARRPVSVAFLPLALATFVIVAFVIAAWTFLAGAM